MKFNIFAENRNMIPALLTEKGLNGFGVEVGVQKGIFSKVLLETSSLQKLYLVDAWRQFDSAYADIANVGPYGHLQAMMQAYLHIYNYRDRAVMIREESVQAAELFPDQSLDFVYLDGDHTRAGITADIKAWLPKVKKGGIISGHDFINASMADGAACDCAVKDVVIAKFAPAQIQITGEPDYPSWMVQL